MFNLRNHTEVHILPLTLGQVRVAVLQFIICHALLTITGIVGIAVAIIITSDPNIELLQILHDFNSNCHYIMHGTSILLTCIGIFGLVAHVVAYPYRIIYSLAAVLMIPFGLTVLAIGESSGISTRNSEGILHQIEALESHYYHRRHDLKDFSKDSVFFGIFQETLGCCGMTDSRDWLLSACNCIPTTCCEASHMDECEKAFLSGDTYQELGFDRTTYEDQYRPLIWKAKCLDQIQFVLGGLKRNWIMFPVIYLILQSILATWSFHISFMLNELANTARGRAQLQFYKGKWPSKNIAVKRNDKKMTTATKDDTKTPASSTKQQVNDTT